MLVELTHGLIILRKGLLKVLVRIPSAPSDQICTLTLVKQNRQKCQDDSLNREHTYLWLKCIWLLWLQIKPDVSTVCFGIAASQGALLLAGGKKGKRFAMPNARIMIHQPQGGCGVLLLTGLLSRCLGNIGSSDEFLCILFLSLPFLYWLSLLRLLFYCIDSLLLLVFESLTLIESFHGVLIERELPMM